MKRTNDIVAVLHTVDFRGDHSADLVVIHKVGSDETVAHLVDRLLGETTHYVPPEVEFIELRILVEDDDDE